MPKNSFVFSFKTTDFVKYHLQFQKISPPSQHRRKASISLRVFYTKGSLTRILGMSGKLVSRIMLPQQTHPGPQATTDDTHPAKAPQRPARDRQTPPQPLPSPWTSGAKKKKDPPMVDIFRNT